MTDTFSDKISLGAVFNRYVLEPELLDVYVEGSDDCSFYSQFIRKKNCLINIIDISIVDFEDVDLCQMSLENNNRDRIIYLIDSLQKEKIGRKVYGIIDKDILPYTRGLPHGPNIYYTDYSCLEMYYFSEVNIKKVQYLCLKKTTYECICGIMQSLLPLTAFRIYEKRHNLSLVKIPLSKYYRGNNLSFDYVRYIENVLLNNRVSHLIKCALSEIDQIINEELSTDNELRNCIRGHDLFEALSIVIHHIEKNPPQKDAIEMIYKASVDESSISEYELFEKLACLQ